jgi:GTP cyclohydrolase I
VFDLESDGPGSEVESIQTDSDIQMNTEIHGGLRSSTDNLQSNGVRSFTGIRSIGNMSSSGIVLVRNIDLYSLCEHHMVPFFGKIRIAAYSTVLFTAA